MWRMWDGTLEAVWPTMLPTIDEKVWRAYGWRSLTVWRVCHVSHLRVAGWHERWQVDALDASVAEAPI
jgi:hypothetical protein